MCCCAKFIAKYALFIVNLAVLLLGLTVIGLGIAALVNLNELNEILPVATIPIVLIVLGSVVFLIAFLGCCGAIRESRWMLICYAVVVLILAALKTWQAVVVFRSLESVRATVDEWLVTAFNKDDLRPAYHVLEASFRCCGTTGVNSYTAVQESIPVSCCANPDTISQCAAGDAFGGCQGLVSEWIESFGSALGGVLIGIIIIELVAVVFALFVSCSARNKKGRDIY